MLSATSASYSGDEISSLFPRASSSSDRAIFPVRGLSHRALLRNCACPALPRLTLRPAGGAVRYERLGLTLRARGHASIEERRTTDDKVPKARSASALDPADKPLISGFVGRSGLAEALQD